MSVNGNGAGGNKPPRLPDVRDDPNARGFQPLPGQVSPERTCLGCVVLAVIVMVCFLFWFWFVSRMEAPPGPPGMPGG